MGWFKKSQIRQQRFSQLNRRGNHKDRDTKLLVKLCDQQRPLGTIQTITVNGAHSVWYLICEGFKRIYYLILNHKHSNESTTSRVTGGLNSGQWPKCQKPSAVKPCDMQTRQHHLCHRSSAGRAGHS